MNRYPIADVLPHSAPMILLDELVGYDDENVSCRVTITPDLPFFDNAKQGVPSYVGCEYMAQTIAAYGGAHALDDAGEVKIGFLLGSRKYHAEVGVFKLAQTLLIEAQKLIQDESGLCVFDCVIKDEENAVLAKAKINVFQPQDPAQFLKDNHE
jgi:predicted hotdog family 3-hydroxylacyl-ACP dehydratase